MMFVPRKKGLGSDNFLKLQDGEEVTGVFKGDIYTYKAHWDEIQKRTVECIGADCPVCLAKPDNRPSFKFRINFITNKDNQWFAKIFQGAGAIYDQLVAMDKKFNLENCIVEIARQGTRQNTKYIITPRMDQPLTKELKAKINSVTLHALSSESSDANE